MMQHTLEMTGMVAVTGGDIHFRYYEPHDPNLSKKTPVIFIHGGPGSSHAILYDALSELADDRPALFYDQLGSYYSPVEMTTDLMMVERFADELITLMNHIGLEKAILCGHSWGGALAAYFSIHHPEKVEGLILSCPLLSTQRWIRDCNAFLAELPVDVQETIRHCEAEGTTSSDEYQAAITLFSSRHFLRSPKHRNIWMKHRHKTARLVYTTMWGPSEFSCHGFLKNFDVFPRLHEIKIPTLLLCGEYDTATPQTMKEAQGIIKNAMLAVIPKSGHAAFLDNNEAYISAVKKYLNAFF